MGRPKTKNENSGWNRSVLQAERQRGAQIVILVLGATGGEVARQLIQAGQKPRLLVLDPPKARAFEGKGKSSEGTSAIRSR